MIDVQLKLNYDQLKVKLKSLGLKPYNSQPDSFIKRVELEQVTLFTHAEVK